MRRGLCYSHYKVFALEALKSPPLPRKFNLGAFANMKGQHQQINYLILRTVSQMIILASELQMEFKERRIPSVLMVVYPSKCFLVWAIVSTLEINWTARRSQGHLDLNLSSARIEYSYFSQSCFHVHSH